MFDFLKSSKHAGLDALVQKIQMNMENNYKDAAQMNLAELEELFQQLKEAGKLNDKQKQNYESVIDSLKIRMKNFTHKDQKPYWT
jgi:hypothetical protein